MQRKSPLDRNFHTGFSFGTVQTINIERKASNFTTNLFKFQKEIFSGMEKS
jgi:hypothetical protein